MWSIFIIVIVGVDARIEQYKIGHDVVAQWLVVVVILVQFIVVGHIVELWYLSDDWNIYNIEDAYHTETIPLEFVIDWDWNIYEYI